MDLPASGSVFVYTQDVTLLNKINETEANAIINGKSSRDLLALIDILMETLEKYRTASSAASYFVRLCVFAAYTPPR